MIVQRAIESAGISTILIAALPPVAKQQGAPRVSAPFVPMGANVGEPNNPQMQRNIIIDSLNAIKTIDSFGEVVELPYEYKAKI